VLAAVRDFLNERAVERAIDRALAALQADRVPQQTRQSQVERELTEVDERI
jgi:hypothetical protein